MLLERLSYTYNSSGKHINIYIYMLKRLFCGIIVNIIFSQVTTQTLYQYQITNKPKLGFQSQLMVRQTGILTTQPQCPTESLNDQYFYLSKPYSMPSLLAILDLKQATWWNRGRRFTEFVICIVGMFACDQWTAFTLSAGNVLRKHW